MKTPAWTSQIRNNVGIPESLTGSCNSSISGWERNSTEEVTSPAPPSKSSGLIPVVGYPGPLFTAIHTSALTSLSLSTVVAISLFIYLCGFRGSVKDHGRGTEVNEKMAVSKLTEGKKKKTRLSFWKWNDGERFVIYLNTCDLYQGISHILDHAYMAYAKDNPPDLICAVFAFFLHNSIFSQWMVVVSIAVSACSLVVFGRKMSLGRYDWRLFVFAFGIPLVISVTAISLGLLGASGAWCFIKHGAPSWIVYTYFVNIFQISTYLLVGLAYGAIWIKIKRTTQLMKGSTTERYQNTAKVMLIFVAIFIFQWCTFTLCNIWSIFATPHPVAFIIAVIFVNIGGIYNSIAYTFIRRRLQRQNRQKAFASNDNLTSCTAANSLGVTSCTFSTPRAVRVPAGLRDPEVLDVPTDVSQMAHMAGEGQRRNSDSGETQNVDPLQICIRL